MRKEVHLMDMNFVTSYSILDTAAHLFQLCDIAMTDWNHINIHNFDGISLINKTMWMF